MYERFTNGARQAMRWANEEAREFSHEFIDTSHLLLGLAEDKSEVAAKALTNLGADKRRIRREVENLIKSGSETIESRRLPSAPRTKAAVEQAMKEARRLNHDYVGTEHLLLGLLCVPETVAVQVLLNLGLTAQSVRGEVLRLLGCDALSDDSLEPYDTEQRGIGAAHLSPFAPGAHDTDPARERYEPYDRFTDRARKVMRLAKEEAQRFNHAYFGTEHILLGLIKEGSGVAANVLKNLGLDLNKIRLEVERLVQSGPVMNTPVSVPRTACNQKVLDYAMEEAKTLNHNYVGTEHLLLGLLREQEGVAAQVLTNLGLTLKEIRQEVLNLMGWGTAAIDASAAAVPRSTEDRDTTPRGLATPDAKAGSPMYEKFTDRARKVFQLSNQEAQRFNQEYICTEHVLLGLLKEGSGVAAAVLKNLDVDLRKIRLEVERLVQSGPDMVTMGALPQTPRAKRVVEFAIQEAQELNHNYVGTEHILLGLLRVEGGVAARVLISLGLTAPEVRSEVLTVLRPGENIKWAQRGAGPLRQRNPTEHLDVGLVHKAVTARARWFGVKDVVLALPWIFLVLGIAGLVLGLADDSRLMVPSTILIGASLIALALGRR